MSHPWLLEDESPPAKQRRVGEASDNLSDSSVKLSQDWRGSVLKKQECPCLRTAV